MNGVFFIFFFKKYKKFQDELIDWNESFLHLSNNSVLLNIFNLRSKLMPQI